MTGTALAILLLGSVQVAVGSSQPEQSPSAIATATKFNVTYDGGRVSTCTITATSGNPEIDLYVCKAARSCGDRYSTAERRDTCVTEKREELARLLARKAERGN